MEVKCFAWDDAKNAKLRADRRIGFEDVVFHIERGDLLDILEHPNPDRYGGQRIFVVRREDYVYLVPFVEDEHTVLELPGPRFDMPLDTFIGIMV
jgi:hypothetical protein